MSQVADLWGDIQTEGQVNKAMKDAADAVDQYRNTRGQDALDQQGAIKQQLEDTFKQYGEGLAPIQQKRYLNAVRSYQWRYLNGVITSHATQQGYEVGKKTNDDKGRLAGDMAARGFNDPQQIDGALRMGRSAALQQLHLDGLDHGPGYEDRVAHATQVSDNAVYASAGEAMFIHNAPGAAAWVDAHRDQLGAYYGPLAEKFRARGEAEGAAQKSDVMRQIVNAPNDVARQGIIRANRGILGAEYDGVAQRYGVETEQAAPQGAAAGQNVVPLGVLPKPRPPEADTGTAGNAGKEGRGR